MATICENQLGYFRQPFRLELALMLKQAGQVVLDHREQARLRIEEYLSKREVHVTYILRPKRRYGIVQCCKIQD